MLVLAPRFIQEMVWMPDDKMDNQPTHNEILQTRYTMHPTLEEDQYYLEIVQKQLTRNLGAFSPPHLLSLFLPLRTTNTKVHVNRTGPSRSGCKCEQRVS